MAHHDSNQGYLDHNTGLMQSFNTTNADLYNIQTGIEMLGIPSKSHANPMHDSWRSSNLTRGPYHESSSLAPDQRQMMVNESSSLRGLYGQPNQGLSLSLFQNTIEAQQHAGFLYGSSPAPSLYQLKGSRFLVPVQELLNEMCSLVGETGGTNRKKGKSKQWDEGGGSSSSSTWSNQNNHFQSLETMELQKIKARLYSMLEEVDRRYRRYYQQMKVVSSSFEAVAGERSALAYTSLASKTMSRHFRRLRDGIVGQINAVKKVLGEKDPSGPHGSRGETPRLKMLDQCIRQHKAIQQAGMMDAHPWRPQRGLPERSVSVLRAWLFEHFLHPYPSDVDKHILARQTGLSRSQVSNWFINARVRLWKPMVEEMYMEEMKDQDSQTTLPSSEQNPNPTPSSDMGSHSELHVAEQKPTPAQLLHESGSLSSIFTSSQHHPSSTDHDSQTQHFGMMDMDFNAYNNTNSQNYGSGVSLTLGLQHHNRGAMNLSFSLASETTLLYGGPPGEPIEEAPQNQFSIVDAEGQSLHYRNIVGAQLLHDLTGT
ncbi:hypothetical protein LUZ60_014613 [Juncus effusus]|nr:hypothetical protein LUZ60_014613 [Juncus effusus]